jgi:hypothetical protein
MLSLFIAAVPAQPALAQSPPSITVTNLDTPKSFTVAQSRSPSFLAANGFPIARQVFLESNAVLQPQEVRSLPGELDSIPVFNSNSPEAIRQPGILLSTFPPQGKLHPDAHLNYALQGRFDVFAHHIAKTDKPDTTPTLYNGVLAYNPSATRSITISVLKAASFLGTPDAPYVNLPAFLENPVGRVYSGPGGRLTDALLRSGRQAHWPSRISLGPKQSTMLMNLPVPVPRPASRSRWVPISRTMLPSLIQQRPTLTPIPLNRASSSNARSTMMQLNSSGPIYMAYLATHASLLFGGREGIPRKSDWENLIINGKLAEPRDRAPSPFDTLTDRFYYGRVSGISRGSQWHARITDKPRGKRLNIPDPGEAFSYGLSTLPRGTFGTGQVQSAPMLARYPDTAYMAHGNYGVHYNLSLPLYNPTKKDRQVALIVQTPLKQNIWDRGLRFLRALPEQIFFRGTVRIRYKDANDMLQERYYHLNQRQGEPGYPLVQFTLEHKSERTIAVDYMYPPDATPPQVLTVQTLDDNPFPQQSAYGNQR